MTDQHMTDPINATAYCYLAWEDSVHIVIKNAGRTYLLNINFMTCFKAQICNPFSKNNPSQTFQASKYSKAEM